MKDFNSTDFLSWCVEHTQEIEELYHEEGCDYIDIDWEQYAMDRYCHEVLMVS